MSDVLYNIELKKPLMPYADVVPTDNDQFRINDNAYLILEPLEIYDEEEENNHENKNKEVRVMFKVFNNDDELLYEDLAPAYLIAAGDKDIAEQNRIRQEEPLNDFLTEFFEHIETELEEAKNKVSSLEALSHPH